MPSVDGDRQRRGGPSPWSLALLLALGGCTGEIGSGVRDAGMDARASTDARVSVDAALDAGGLTSDAGELADAGATSDAGAMTDAGFDAGFDAGPPCRPEPMDCSPSSVSMEDYCVRRAASCYQNAVRNAVNGVVRDHPTWFDSSGSCNVILPASLADYMDDVVARIVAAGLCAIRDPNAPLEEVTVKYSNVFAENFDIVASTGCARSGAPYTSTCFPAWW